MDGISEDDPSGSRRSISRRGLFYSALGLFIPLRLFGGQQPTFSSEVKVVNVLTTVRDRKGQIVANLTQEDFRIEEDGRPQTIRYFTRETDLPLTLGLLVDTSLSQAGVLGEEREASYRFLEQVLREDRDRAFLIHFDREVEMLQDLTSSRAKLEAALKLLELPRRPHGGGSYPGPTGGGRSGGPNGAAQWPGSGPRRGPGGGRGGPGRGPRMGGVGTLLYDAVLLASEDVMKEQTGRKAVIVLSDGVDHGSSTALAEAIRAAHRADTMAYSILFADDRFSRGGFGGGGGYPGRAPDGKEVLRQLSRETGAAFYEVSKKQSIDQVFSLIQEELRHQYNLGYTPDRTNAAPGFHRIQVSTPNRDLIVQTRDGYYADH